MLQMDNSKLVVDGLYLFSQSEYHSQYTLTAFNHYLILPLLHDKLRIFYDNDKPVSLVTWCWLSDEKADLFLSDQYTPTEDDYVLQSGDQLWGIEYIAPFGHARQTMRNMRRISSELYGPKTAVHWQRYKKPAQIHKRTF